MQAPSNAARRDASAAKLAKLATGGLDGSIVIWSTETGKRLTTLRHKDRVLAIAYGGGAGQDIQLASVDEKGIAKVWDAHTFALRRELKSYNAALFATAFSRDGRFLVTAGDDLSIWETASGARLPAISGRGKLFAASIRCGGPVRPESPANPDSRRSVPTLRGTAAPNPPAARWRPDA